MNQVNLIGRLTKDPELKSDNKGNNFLPFTMAVDKPFVNKETGKRDASFIEVYANGNAAEIIAKYLKKGQQLAITGWLDMGSYKKDDEWVSYARVRLQEFYFIGNKGQEKEKAHDRFDDEETEGYDDDNVSLPFEL